MGAVTPAGKSSTLETPLHSAKLEPTSEQCQKQCAKFVDVEGPLGHAGAWDLFAHVLS